jgi:hypothetical protein
VHEQGHSVRNLARQEARPSRLQEEHRRARPIPPLCAVCQLFKGHGGGVEISDGEQFMGAL